MGLEGKVEWAQGSTHRRVGQVEQTDNPRCLEKRNTVIKDQSLGAGSASVMQRAVVRTTVGHRQKKPEIKRKSADPNSGT